MFDSKQTILQEQLYEFPYHHLPYWTPTGAPKIHRALQWGLAYLNWTNVVLDEIHAIAPKSILDVGCGDGRLLGLVGEGVPVRVGIDQSQRAIAFAKAFYPAVKWYADDIHALKGSFDCVTLVEVLEHVPDDAILDFMGTVSRCCKPGGYLILSVPTINLPVPLKHYRHYSEALLKNHISDDFVLQSVKYVCKESWVFHTLQKIIINNFWVLNSPWLLTWVWNVYKKQCYWANEKNGGHMISVARKVSG